MQMEGTANAVVPHLPMIIISDVLSRLPVDDVTRCKSVCKSWYNLSKDPHFTHLHCSRSSEMFRHQRHNILFWKADDSGNYRTYIRQGGLYLLSNVEEDTMWKTSIISHRGHYIGGTVLASCNGLLCINTLGLFSLDSKGPDVVYNPLTEDSISLPRMIYHPHYERNDMTWCGLGYDSINKKYKVVLAYHRKCYRDGSSDWSAFGIACTIITVGEYLPKVLQFPEECESSIYSRVPLFFNGAFHWAIGTHLHLADNGETESRIDGLLALDVSSEEFKITMFSNSLVLHAPYIQQIQLENSLAFYHSEYPNPGGDPSFEIWQILGAHTDGSCLYKHKTFTLSGPPFSTLKNFSLLGALSNGAFLFEASPKSGPGCNKLALYNPEKDEGSVIEIAEAPNYFISCIFTPSLISPFL